MKKSVLLLGVFALGLVACEAKTEEKKEEKQEVAAEPKQEAEVKEEVKADEPEVHVSSISEKSEYESFLTDDLIASIGKSEYPEMYQDGAPDKVNVKVHRFTPPGWDHEFAYCDIKYHKGNERKKVSVAFMPNGEGVLNDMQYGVIAKQDDACQQCDLVKINITADEHVTGDFVDVNDPDLKFTKEMDYNFQEMYITWSNLK